MAKFQTTKNSILFLRTYSYTGTFQEIYSTLSVILGLHFFQSFIQRYSTVRLFLNILESKTKTPGRSPFLVKLQILDIQFYQKGLPQGFFHWKFADFFRAAFFLNNWLLDVFNKLLLTLQCKTSQNGQTHYKKSCSECCKIFEECLTTSGLYALKGWYLCFIDGIPEVTIWPRDT